METSRKEASYESHFAPRRNPTPIQAIALAASTSLRATVHFVGPRATLGCACQAMTFCRMQCLKLAFWAVAGNYVSMLTSLVCRYEHFRSDWYLHWSHTLGYPPVVDTIDTGGSHRKIWEWCAISQALEERGMLQPGKVGLGFAVGQEPLPSAFAARGVRVVATDRPQDGAPNGWSASGQHATSLDVLFKENLIGKREFSDRVTFAPADMTDIGHLENGGYDFLWSSCALEHLGTLQAGVDFIEASLPLLKVGGVAVHTTEYNISSDAETLADGPSVIYRQRDIEAIGQRLRALSARLSRPDFDPGDEPADLEFDHDPYFHNRRYHIKLLLSGFVTTSMLLIIQRYNPPRVQYEPVLRTL